MLEKDSVVVTDKKVISLRKGIRKLTVIAQVVVLSLMVTAKCQNKQTNKQTKKTNKSSVTNS